MIRNNNQGFTFFDITASLFLLFIIIIVVIPSGIKKYNKLIEKSLIAKTNKMIEKVLANHNDEKLVYTFANKLETSTKKLNYKGSNPKHGVIIVREDGKIALALSNGKHCAKKDYLTNLITITKENLEDCKLPYSDDTGAVGPILKEAMIPVTFDGTSWVKADLNQKWYDYGTKTWANVVLIKELLREYYQLAEPGTKIEDIDVYAHLVWIPRYKYQLFNVNSLSTSVKEIPIIFESITDVKSSGTKNDEWLTHPAFTFGNQELNGIWVGKFETTGTRSRPTIKPNMPILSLQNVGSQFNIASVFNEKNTYGLNKTDETHMMKNTEWGAVAYLTNSKYGKNSEVWVNPSFDFITGCAGDSVSSPLTTGCPNEYTSVKGQEASTTGNVYGIYDMSGGTAEYVMGGLYDNNQINIKLSLATFDDIDNPNMNKYINKYAYGRTANDQRAYDRRIIGDATSETRGWYQDNANFIMHDEVRAGYGNFWFIRGGYYNDKTKAGIFSFSSQDGAPYKYNGFRIVIPGKE